MHLSRREALWAFALATISPGCLRKEDIVGYVPSDNTTASSSSTRSCVTTYACEHGWRWVWNEQKLEWVTDGCEDQPI